MNITLKNKIKNRPTQIKNIKIGLTNKFSLKVTEKLHNDFKKFSGDNSPIHSDFKFCKENNYKKKLGYAFLITSALSKIFGVYFPGGNELCLHQFGKCGIQECSEYFLPGERSSVLAAAA